MHRPLILPLGIWALSAASCASGDLDFGSAADGAPIDLCAASCDVRAASGCVASVTSCVETCELARAGATCVGELDAHLECLVRAGKATCGTLAKTVPGAECAEELAVLEACVAGALPSDPPRGCGRAPCPEPCGLVGREVCVPLTTAPCACSSGGEGTTTCTPDGCAWTPCTGCAR